MRRRRWVWLVLSIFLGVGHVSAAILYVDKDTGCPGSGTTGSPYCSIQNAFNVVNPGDSIRIRDSATPYLEWPILTRSGSNGSPIIIEPDVGHTPILTWNKHGCTNCLEGAIDLSDVHDVTLQNLTFNGSGVDTSTFAVWIHGGATMVRIQVLGNTFTNWGGTQAQAANSQSRSTMSVSGGWNSVPNGPQGTVIRGNTFSNNRQRNLQVTNADNTLIEQNTFTNVKCGNDTDGAINTIAIHIQQGIDTPGESGGTLIRNNVFHDFELKSACTLTTTGYDTLAAIWCDEGHINGEVSGNLIYKVNQGDSNTSNHASHGIFIERECSGWLVKNNVVHTIGFNGIRQRGYDFGTNPSTWTGAANTYANNTIWSVGGKGFDLSTGKTIVENNVVYNAGQAQIHFDTANAGVHTVDYNLYFDTSGGNRVGDWGGSTLTFANWKTACNCDSHSLNADPVFVSTTSGAENLALQTSSPAKNTGLTLGSVPLDFAGITRPQGSAYDMGAYEFVIAGGSVPVLLRIIR